MSGAHGRDGSVPHWCERLARAHPNDEPVDWAHYRSLPAQLRQQVVMELKARVDELVRRTPEQARPLTEVLVSAADGLPHELPLALRSRAAAAHFSLDEPRARADFERAAELHTSLSQPVETARVLRSLVDVHQMAGRPELALTCAERARAIFEEHGEDRFLAQLDMNVGNVFTRLDDYPTAERHYTAARAIFERLDDELGLAVSDFNLAVVALNANRCDEAEAAWSRARVGMGNAGMDMFVADCDYNLAYLQSRRGRFGEALQGLEDARAQYQRLGKPAGPPLCDLDLAEIHLRLGTLLDAQRLADSAIAAFESLGLGYELARAYVLRGIARARLGQHAGARDDLLAAELRFLQQGNQTFSTFVRLQRTPVELALGNTDDMILGLAQARDSLAERGTPWLSDMASLTLARALLMAGRPNDAMAELDALSQRQESTANNDGLLPALSLRLRADALLALGRRTEALTTLEAAVSATDAAWGNVPGGDVRLAFFSGQHPAFVDLTCLLLDAGRAHEALLVFEHGRSRSLLETSPLAHDPEWSAAREQLDWLLARRLDEQLGPLAGGADLRKALAGSGPAAAAVRLARDKLNTIARSRRGRTSPAPERLDASELLPACRDDELLLVYVAGSLGTRVLMLERSPTGTLSVTSAALEITTERLSELRDRVRFQLARHGRGASAVRRLRAALSELGAALLEPVAARLQGPNGPRPLVIVPCGALHDLPLHALEFGGLPLAARHEVSQAMSVWHLARVRRRAAAAPGERPAWCLGATLGLLPQVAHEVAHVQQVLGPRLSLLEPDDLMQRLSTSSLSGSLLHIAGHGSFEAERPRFSALCLGDTFLLAHDVSTRRLDLDLVVLSGCETGRIRNTGGDELMGLPRAFLGAGVRAVVGSLWPVGDGDAAAFMRAFYDSLSQGRTARQALAAARSERLAHSSDPVCWAAFSLLGDPDVSLTPHTFASAPRMKP